MRKKGRLTADDVHVAMREVKMALLEADVNFKVVRKFTKTVEEKAIGEDVMNGLNPAQMVIKIVHDEMVSLLGGETEEIRLRPSSDLTVLMMIGLQGAGKTTTAAKLGAKFRSAGRKVLLAAADVYRPAAIEQLKVNGAKVGVDVFSLDASEGAVKIASEAAAHAKKNGYNLLIIDTAGRLQIDEAMMKELQAIKEAVKVDSTILVVDAMTGQEAVNVATAFRDEVGIEGVILTKCDGDTRGGAALSVRSVTGCPIYYAGMGEKLADLEVFHPARMADRILGMGDVMTLIEKAQEAIDEEQAAAMEKKLRKASFDFNDYLMSMEQMRNMGGIESVLSMLPGMSTRMGDISEMIDEGAMARTEAIIRSMTPKERANPDLLNPSRKNRIAKGAGVTIDEVNRLVKQFTNARKMMKQMPGIGGKRMPKRGGFKFPFGL